MTFEEWKQKEINIIKENFYHDYPTHDPKECDERIENFINRWKEKEDNYLKRYKINTMVTVDFNLPAETENNQLKEWAKDQLDHFELSGKVAKIKDGKYFIKFNKRDALFDGDGEMPNFKTLNEHILERISNYMQEKLGQSMVIDKKGNFELSFDVRWDDWMHKYWGSIY